MGKEIELFEASGAYKTVNSILASQADKYELEGATVEVFEEVSSLEEFSVNVTDDNNLKYTYETNKENVYLICKVTFKQEQIKDVAVELGYLTDPLSGYGHRWELEADGEVKFDNRWLA